MSIDDRFTPEDWEKKFKHDKWLENENQKRIEALYSGDHKTYAQKTLYLGIEPEDTYAYEKGMADIMYGSIYGNNCPAPSYNPAAGGYNGPSPEYNP